MLDNTPREIRVVAMEVYSQIQRELRFPLFNHLLKVRQECPIVDYLEMQGEDFSEHDHKFFWTQLGKEELSTVFFLSSQPSMVSRLLENLNFGPSECHNTSMHDMSTVTDVQNSMLELAREYRKQILIDVFLLNTRYQQNPDSKVVP